MNEASIFAALRAKVVALLAALVAILWAVSAAAQPDDSNMRAELFAEGAPAAGETWMLALKFTPRSEEWHGYWSNPGDAGLGMELDWTLPKGWRAGEPIYPVPHRLLIAGLMNHVYEGEYAVLVPMKIPAGAAPRNASPIGLIARYLACTDTICVPQQARLTLDPRRAATSPLFSEWRTATAPELDSPASFEFSGAFSGERLRIGIPLPATAELVDPHLFIEQRELGGGRETLYAEAQTFRRQGNLLVAELPLRRLDGMGGSEAPNRISGILAFGNGDGVRFEAGPGDVPLEGAVPLSAAGEDASLWVLMLAALAGGLLLNIMPCVFPILSLKALALATAGGDQSSARRDALAYTAGVVIACATLGALLLVLRAAGENVGWAFQLQEPGVVVALLLLAVAITANFLGLFEVPGMAISGGGATRRGSFATGLLAAFVATPCTGPFMAAALGAALLLPPVGAMALFVTLGIGLALPFLLIGFIPALRARLPRPGPWMATFRRWMALPMGLTALALLWLTWRIGGDAFAIAAALLTAAALAVLWLYGRWQGGGRGWSALAALVAMGGLAWGALPQPAPQSAASASLLDPEPFGEQALAEARASGRPVFVWFTADWCLTCKVNESVAIERKATAEAFERAGVISLRGDWTLRDTEITEFLTREGAAGVPLYLWYPPGGEAQQLPQVLTPDRLADLARDPA